MATWSKAEIMQKIRQVTGRFTEREMTNDELSKRLNQYYQLRFPAEVKLEQKHVYYEFQTIPNQATYDVPDSTYTMMPYISDATKLKGGFQVVARLDNGNNAGTAEIGRAHV